ncbi:MAG: hypothetical protein ACKVZJ_12810 [Phycisphaerales bacterium]
MSQSQIAVAALSVVSTFVAVGVASGGPIMYLSASHVATAMSERYSSSQHPATAREEWHEPSSVDITARAETFWDHPTPLFNFGEGRVASQFGENSVLAHCEAWGGSHALGGGYANESGGGASFQTEFFVDAPGQDFRFTAILRYVSVFTDPHEWAVRLEGPQGTIVSLSYQTSGPYYQEPIDVIRPAVRGTYTMHLSVSGESCYPIDSHFRPIFDASFVIPAPGVVVFAGALAALALQRRR